MNFISVDVETANVFRGSICQIGWTIVEGGIIQQVESILINPQQEFDPFNVRIHGIHKKVVKDSPTFSDVKENFRGLMSSMPVVSYGMFDRAAFALADDRCLDTQFVPDTPWLNVQRVVRRAWPEKFHKKCNLKFVADSLGISLNHHDAKSDAKAAAKILLLAAEEMNLKFEDIFVRAHKPITPRKYNPIKYDAINYESGNDGPLVGEVITFTGSLSLSRRDAAMLANKLGAGVAPNTNSKTTILVVGVQDRTKIVGDKSNKHIRAEELIEKGQVIEIISESDFLRMINH